MKLKTSKILISSWVLFIASTLLAQSDLKISLSALDDSTFSLNWNVDKSIEIPSGSDLFLLSKPSIVDEWIVIDGPLENGAFPKEYSTQFRMESQNKFYTLGIKSIPSNRSPGEIIRTKLIKKYSLAEILTSITEYTGGFPTIISNEVNAFEIVYWTPGLDGKLREASGVAFLPVGKTSPKSIISYQHGTLYDKEDAPSLGQTEEFSIGLFLAGTEHICFMADYLGFGASADMFHPYLHSETEASSALDMLRAGTQLVSESNHTQPEKLFLLGYSQGGHATMALHRTIELEAGDEFIITGSIPMAGPQSMSNVMLSRILSDAPYPNPFYIAYLVWSYDQAYGLFNDPNEYFVDEVATALKQMIQDGASDGAINDVLPTVPRQMFKSNVLELIQSNDNHPFRVALELNDTMRSGWQPQAPIQMYHCTDDEIVPYQNSILAKESLQRAEGPAISVTDPRLIPFFQNGSHTGCIPWALLAVNDWINDRI